MLKPYLTILLVGILSETWAQTNGPPTGWSPQFRGGSIHHLNTDLEGGGRVGLNRYYVEGALAYLFRRDRLVSFSTGYGRDDYRFDRLAVHPWDDIDSYRAGIFTRWGFDNNWTSFAAGSIRTYAEMGASLSDAVSGAIFGGASYRFSDRLSLGPGLGVVGQLEDDPNVFPIIVIDWNITERLNLSTGGGMAATGGPGLSLTWKIDRNWYLGLAGRYERKRFRLDDRGIAPDGVGEDQSIPVTSIVSYQLYPGTRFSFLLGVNLDGQMKAEDEQGDTVYKVGYDTVLFSGFTAEIRF